MESAIRGNSATVHPSTLVINVWPKQERCVEQCGKKKARALMSDRKKKQCSLFAVTSVVVTSQTDVAVSPLRIPALTTF